jgi:uncharacterized membrane protein YraQ (UPF0718 family)
MDFLAVFATRTWNFLLEASPLLLLGFLLAGAVKALLPAGRLVRWIGGRGMGGVFRAALAGVPLPLCSCGVIPVAATLRKEGASRGATIAFLISTPETGVDSIAASAAMLDPVMTIFRPVAAFVAAAMAGVAQLLFGEPDAPAATSATAKPAGGCGCCGSKKKAANSSAESGASSCGDVTAPLPATWAGRGKLALRYAFVELFEDLGGLLLLGFLLAGFIAALAPNLSLSDLAGASAWGELGEMLAMIALGIPLYVCATAATPLAAALIAAGVSPGAALAFLMAGPATNAASIALTVKIVGRRGAAIYLVSIAVSALAMGALLNALYPLLGMRPWAFSGEAKACAFFCETPLAYLSAIAIAGLSLWGLWRRRFRPAPWKREA